MPIMKRTGLNLEDKSTCMIMYVIMFLWNDDIYVILFMLVCIVYISVEY